MNRLSLISTLFPYTTLFRSGNLWAPPLHFGRQPPQLNYPPDTVPDPDHGPRLDIQFDQSGISTATPRDRKSTRLNSSHSSISYAVFCLKKKKIQTYNQLL